MTEQFKYELPELPDELKFAKTEREKAYLQHVKLLTEKIKRDFSTGMFHAEEFRRQPKSQGAYIFIDGDGLKKINDVTQDHGAGDAAIKAIARGINEALRARDNVTIARMGGDEFSIFIEGVSLSQAVQIAQRILKSIRAQTIDYKGDSAEVREILQEWPLSASIGVGRTEQEADNAMYQAKSNGRNRVEFFMPDRLKSAKVALAKIALKAHKSGNHDLSEKIIKTIEGL